MLSFASSRLSVTITSTWVPGTTKPATPITSLTLTETARMPSVIDGGRPAPASSGASLVSVSGSLAATESIRPRLRTLSMVVKPLVTGLLAGQATSLTWSLVIMRAHRHVRRRDHLIQAADLDLAHGHLLDGAIDAEAGERGDGDRDARRRRLFECCDSYV